MSTALTLKGVMKSYRRHQALNGLDLEVPTGSIFGLVGSNGAGKTTAMCAVAGLLKIQSGSIDILGAGAFDAATHAGRISLLPQDAALPAHARVEQVLNYYGRLQGIAKSDLREQIHQVIDWVNLSDRRRSKIGALSHGMRRRVSIAQAFLGHPELILMDEPLNGLDPREVVNIRHLIQERKGKQTMVISSHLLNEVEAACDHVAFIEKGRLIRQDELLNIMGRHAIVRYILGCDELDLSNLTGVVLDFNREEKVLTVESTEEDDIAKINAKILPELLARNIPILEIKRGHDLEQEYLKSS